MFADEVDEFLCFKVVVGACKNLCPVNSDAEFKARSDIMQIYIESIV